MNQQIETSHFPVSAIYILWSYFCTPSHVYHNSIKQVMFLHSPIHWANKCTNNKCHCSINNFPQTSNNPQINSHIHEGGCHAKFQFLNAFDVSNFYACQLASCSHFWDKIIWHSSAYFDYSEMKGTTHGHDNQLLFNLSPYL